MASIGMLEPLSTMIIGSKSGTLEDDLMFKLALEDPKKEQEGHCQNHQCILWKDEAAYPSRGIVSKEKN